MNNLRFVGTIVYVILWLIPSPSQAQDWNGFEPIPDSNPEGATVQIVVPDDGEAPVIGDLDVDVIIEHPRQGDLVIVVTHVESGHSALLMNRPGVAKEFPLGFEEQNLGDPGDFGEFLFDDEAPMPYDFPFVKPPGIPNVVGTWQPDSDPLAVFDGESLAGLWILTVSDVEAGPPGDGFIRRFSLHVTPECQPPVITQQPLSHTVCTDDPITLSVEVEGTGPFHYEWFFEDLVFENDDPVFQIDEAALGWAGNYGVAVTGACGAVFSDQAEVNVTERCHLEPPDCPLGSPMSGCGCAADDGSIYLFSGEFHHSAVDLRISGRGLDFVWSRRYRSQISDPFSFLGNGWDFSYNIRLIPQGSAFLLMDGNHRKDLFFPQKDGTWIADEFFRILEQNKDGSFTMKFEDTGTWNFNGPKSDAPFTISNMVDRNGNTLAFGYNVNGRLITIHDTLDTEAHNRDISIGYNKNGRIESVTDFAGRSVTYEYYEDGDAGGSFGDLKSVTTPAVLDTREFPIPPGHDYPDGKTTIYTYSKGFADERLNHNLLTITDPKGQTYLTNGYAPTQDSGDLEHDRIVRQTWGDPGDIIDMVYVPQIPAPENNQAVVKAIVNDRVGNVSEYFYDALNRLVIERDYTGRWDPDLPTLDGDLATPLFPKLRPDDPDFFETRYEWNIDSLATRTVFPNLNEAVNTYDSDNDSQRSQGNMLQRCTLPGDLGGDQAMICETFEYDDDFGGCCGSNFVTRHVDGRGNETLHEYDASGNRTHTTHRIPSIVEDFEYNGFGQMTKRTLPDNGSDSRREDVYTYYDSGPQLGYLHEEFIDQPGFALTTTYEYDLVGNLTRMTDPRGHDTLYDVNQLNQVVRRTSREVTDGSGVRYQRETFYDANDYVIRIEIQNIDDGGIEVPENPTFTTTYEYDILNYLTRQTQEVNPDHNIVTEYVYDANRNRTLVRYGEATNGNQPANVVRTLYDERDLVFREIKAEDDANQSSTQYDYDGNRNQTRTSQGLEDVGGERITLYTYDGYDRLFASTDPMGNITQYHYDPNHNMVSMRVDGEHFDVEGSAGNLRLHETTYEYDAMDRLTREVKEFFDTETQNPLMGGQQLGESITETQYSDNSQVTAIINDNLHATTTVYDTANRRLTITDAKANSMTYAYDPNSNVITVVEVEKSDLLNPDEEFTTTYAYDNLDRLISTMDNVGNTDVYAYDSRNNRTFEDDALDHETRYVYDGINRLTRTIRDLDDDGADGDGPDVTTTQTWDDTSRVTGQTDDNGNTTSYFYDALNRLVGRVYADNTVYFYNYDVHHNVNEMLDANESFVEFDYDLLNRTVEKFILPGEGVADDLMNGTTFEFYAYDGLSRLTGAADNDSLILRAYDSLSNLTIELFDEKQFITSVYDGVGNQLSCTYPGGRTIECTYDELERKKEISDTGEAIATYDYVGPGRVERREYGNGTRADFVYDGITGIPNPASDFGVRRLIGITHSKVADGSIIDDRTFTWDPLYNKLERIDIRDNGPELTTEYVYDSIYRLTRTTVTDDGEGIVRDTQYDLDGVGNRVEVIGEPDPGLYVMDPTLPQPADFQLNQYTLTPVESREYDENGNLINRAGLATVTYDYRNQMVAYDDFATGQLHLYMYDALGRRIARVVNANEEPGDVTRYFYDDWQVVEEQDDTKNPGATYVYGIYIDEVLNMQRDEENYFYHAADLYNIMVLTDGGGSVVERYEYDDYGRPAILACATDLSGDGATEAFDLGILLGSWGECPEPCTPGDPATTCAADLSGDCIVEAFDLGILLGGWGGCPDSDIDIDTGVGNPYLFTGRRFDPETGWYYYRTRYLDPAAGRFTTRDTIGIWGDEANLGNGYAYVGNNPATRMDPTGLFWQRTPPAPGVVWIGPPPPVFGLVMVWVNIPALWPTAGFWMPDYVFAPPPPTPVIPTPAIGPPNPQAGTAGGGTTTPQSPGGGTGKSGDAKESGSDSSGGTTTTPTTPLPPPPFDPNPITLGPRRPIVAGAPGGVGAPRGSHPGTVRSTSGGTVSPTGPLPFDLVGHTCHAFEIGFHTGIISLREGGLDWGGPVSPMASPVSRIGGGNEIPSDLDAAISRIRFPR